MSDPDETWKELEAMAEEFERTFGACSVLGKEELARAKDLLSTHSPIASEDELPEGLFDELAAAFSALAQQPQIDTVATLIAAVGDDTPPSLEQMAIDALLKLPREEVLREIETRLGTGKRASLAALRFAESFPDSRFRPRLIELVHHSETPQLAVAATGALAAVQLASGGVSAAELLTSDYPHKAQVDEAMERLKQAGAALQAVRMRYAMQESERAFQEKNFAKVVEKLSPYASLLTGTAKKRFDVCKRLRRKGTGREALQAGEEPAAS